MVIWILNFLFVIIFAILEIIEYHLLNGLQEMSMGLIFSQIIDEIQHSKL